MQPCRARHIRNGMAALFRRLFSAAERDVASSFERNPPRSFASGALSSMRGLISWALIRPPQRVLRHRLGRPSSQAHQARRILATPAPFAFRWAAPPGNRHSSVGMIIIRLLPIRAIAAGRQIHSRRRGRARHRRRRQVCRQKSASSAE